MRALRTLLFSTAAGVAVLGPVCGDANADPQVAITYIQKSLAEAYVAGGPWTLHQRGGRNPHDASGILPPSGVTTPYNPPTTAYGTPYANYCVGGQVQTAQRVNPMQPY